jgi:hypothetical protein
MIPPVGTIRMLDRLEETLQAGCAALIALESARARAGEPGSDIDMVEAEINRMIAGLRESIAELRALSGERTSVVADGFVLDTASESPGQPQLSP